MYIYIFVLYVHMLDFHCFYSFVEGGSWTQRSDTLVDGRCPSRLFTAPLRLFAVLLRSNDSSRVLLGMNLYLLLEVSVVLDLLGLA